MIWSLKAAIFNEVAIIYIGKMIIEFFFGIQMKIIS